MKIIDISLPIKRNMPIWPKSVKPDFKLVSSHKKGDLWTETEIHMNLHTGTHIDAPLHRIKNGVSVDRLPLESMIGQAAIVYLPKAEIITDQELMKLHLSQNINRILFKTTNSDFWLKHKIGFQKKFVALNVEAALWLAKRKIKLVGCDYLSVAPFGNTSEVHEILLKKGIVLLEGLNLSKVKPGVYQLVCFPLNFVGSEASPVRAVLMH